MTTKPTMVWTPEYSLMGGAVPDNTMLHELHAYAVLGFMKSPWQDYVVLRDPWGYNTPFSQPHPEGPWPLGPGVNGTDEVILGEKGVFAVHKDWFYKAFRKVGWINLRRDVAIADAVNPAPDPEQRAAGDRRWMAQLD